MNVFRQVPLYRFLDYCLEDADESGRLSQSGHRGFVFDCGAGGRRPPLSLFYSAGFKTGGIEIDPENLKNALEAAAEEGCDWGIEPGDMRCISRPDNFFTAVYSYNSIFHMIKKDIRKTLGEMDRILKENGLLFVNFLSDEDPLFGEGREIGPGEFEQQEGDSTVIHTFVGAKETEAWFENIGSYTLLFKETRYVERNFEGDNIRQVYIDYIYQKK